MYNNYYYSFSISLHRHVTVIYLQLACTQLNNDITCLIPVIYKLQYNECMQGNNVILDHI